MSEQTQPTADAVKSERDRIIQALWDEADTTPKLQIIEGDANGE